MKKENRLNSFKNVNFSTSLESRHFFLISKIYKESKSYFYLPIDPKVETIDCDAMIYNSETDQIIEVIKWEENIEKILPIIF